MYIVCMYVIVMIRRPQAYHILTYACARIMQIGIDCHVDMNSQGET